MVLKIRAYPKHSYEDRERVGRIIPVAVPPNGPERKSLDAIKEDAHTYARLMECLADGLRTPEVYPTVLNVLKKLLTTPERGEDQRYDGVRTALKQLIRAEIESCFRELAIEHGIPVPEPQGEA